MSNGQTPEALALATARAIAYEIERRDGVPGWASKSMQPEGAPDCPPEAECSFCGPRTLTTLAAAHAEWAAAGGDPERGPALSGTGPDGAGWSVHVAGERVIVRCMQDRDEVAIWHSEDDQIEWCGRPGIAALSIDVPREVVARIVTLATAAKIAMGT